MLCAKFGGNWPYASAEGENVKSLQKGGQKDNKWSEKHTLAFNSGELPGIDKCDWSIAYNVIAKYIMTDSFLPRIFLQFC